MARVRQFDHRLVLFLVLSSLPTLISCGDSGSGPETPVATSVSVSPPSSTLVSLGETVQFSAQVRDESGNAMTGAGVSWSSSNNSVATVSSSGMGTAASDGTATIRATAGSATGTASLTVAQAVASVAVTAPDDTLKALGITSTLTAEPKDARGNAVAGKTATWSSSNTGTATIDSGGTVTAVANGTTTITATVDGIDGIFELVVEQMASGFVITTQPGGAAAGVAFTTQPVLELRDSGGSLAANDNTTQVTAAIASGGGDILGTTVVTAAEGIATFTDLAVGGSVGDRTLGFTAPELTSATSDVFALARGPAAQLTVIGGNNQTALAATALPEALSVKVADAYNNGVEAIEVAWAVTAGSGTLTAATSVSDASGLATNSYTLGAFAGIDNISASVDGLSGSPGEFTVTATPNGTVSGTITLSDALLAPPQSTKVGSVASIPLVRPGGNVPPRRPVQAEEEDRPFSSGPQPVEYLPDELIVNFKPAAVSAPAIGSSAMASPNTVQTVRASIRSALASHVDGSRATTKGISPAILAARIKVEDPAELESVAAEFRADPAVATVERNGIVARTHSLPPLPLGPVALPNDRLYVRQAWHYAMVDLPEAWAITTGDPSVVVAVVDDGIRFDHPMIAGNLTSDGYDFVDDSQTVDYCAGGSTTNADDGDGYDPDPTNPSDWWYDETHDCIYNLLEWGNHGLHVAGTIGAIGNDGEGVLGVNWSVAIRPVRVLGLVGGTSYDIAQGILYAAGLPADDGAGGPSRWSPARPSST